MVPPPGPGHADPPPSSRYQLTSVYASTDQGASFSWRGNMVRHTCESDILPLGNGTLLASIRYQTPNSQSATAVPGHLEGMPRFKQTAVSHSGDGGRTWLSEPRWAVKSFSRALYALCIHLHSLCPS
jgi:hypothetical protein